MFVQNELGSQSNKKNRLIENAIHPERKRESQTQRQGLELETMALLRFTGLWDFSVAQGIKESYLKNIQITLTPFSLGNMETGFLEVGPLLT